jgi:hypothetical protein
MLTGSGVGLTGTVGVGVALGRGALICSTTVGGGDK